MRNIAKHVSQMVALLAVLIFSTVSAFATPFAETNWQDNVITVTGTGVAPAHARTPVQGRMLARRAAVVDAYRYLAEYVQGVQVEAESKVQDLAAASDLINTKVKAVVQGARIVSEKEIPGGGYEVTMSMPLFGAGSLATAVMPTTSPQEVFPEPVQSVAPSMPAYDASASVSVRVEVTANATAAAPAPAANSNAIGNYTGIIVDCRGLGLNPVMSPVIMNQNGEKIYGHRNLNPDFVISNGMASYTTDLNSGCTRAGNNPLVVKAVSLQSHNSYPVLSVADANRVLIENKASGFLEKTNVVFIR
ncbi:hypothetical protein SAMN05216582_101154 [Selenomonas ruminantium]|uniref:Lipoprotein LPP20-like domain-containing protein n=1 Tax=Selenomonas ruminantium TaxID=971 RepID=A0A1M6R4Y3_SELRU|nr:LPP20 family lipoprotein [Selenomonas ruminantium]SHK27460.1 hypothetical protein SAMN05216582_101154 [Selenomonas ruminantium]